jgi:hypothetical protein
MQPSNRPNKNGEDMQPLPNSLDELMASYGNTSTDPDIPRVIIPGNPTYNNNNQGPVYQPWSY